MVAAALIVELHLLVKAFGWEILKRSLPEARDLALVEDVIGRWQKWRIDRETG